MKKLLDAPPKMIQLLRSSAEKEPFPARRMRQLFRDRMPAGPRGSAEHFVTAMRSHGDRPILNLTQPA